MRAPASMAASNVAERSGCDDIHSKNGRPFAVANGSTPSRTPTASWPSAPTTSGPPAKVTQGRQPPGWSPRRNFVTRVGRTRSRRSKRIQPRVALYRRSRSNRSGSTCAARASASTDIGCSRSSGTPSSHNATIVAWSSMPNTASRIWTGGGAIARCSPASRGRNRFVTAVAARVGARGHRGCREE